MIASLPPDAKPKDLLFAASMLPLAQIGKTGLRGLSVAPA
jgi:hypothetical protein